MRKQLGNLNGGDEAGLCLLGQVEQVEQVEQAAFSYVDMAEDPVTGQQPVDNAQEAMPDDSPLNFSAQGARSKWDWRVEQWLVASFFWAVGQCNQQPLPSSLCLSNVARRRPGNHLNRSKRTSRKNRYVTLSSNCYVASSHIKSVYLFMHRAP